MACRRSRVVLISLAASLLLTIAAGCGNGLQRINPPKINASAAAAQAMAMYDTNKDGKISGDEFRQCASLKAIAKDGTVTSDVLASLFAKWTDSGIGREGANVRILHNGKQLAGAAVRLVPEKFLGTDIQPATGKTDAFGATILSVPTRDPGEPKGVSLGFYRVEITKDGENVPAVYNTETTLSMGVLGDQTGGPTFNLVY